MEVASETKQHDDMDLYVTHDCFIIEPNDQNEQLLIDRVTGVVHWQATKHFKPGYQYNKKRVCGILGCISLFGAKYMLVATHRLFIGVLNGCIIYRLAGYDIIPYIPTRTHLSSQQYDYVGVYMKMLRKTLDTKYFYFSYNYDLTHTLQRITENNKLHLYKKSIYERADPRFLWNGALLENFNSNEMQYYLLPITMGFVSINQVQLNGQTFFWSIISRRSIQRAGTRLFCRGANQYGHVANFVETEQIVEFHGDRISFVQTRGSMPFYWHQLPNLRYKPAPTLISGKDHFLACVEHFNEQLMLYDKQVIVNLVDQKGAEGQLEKTFRQIVAEMNNPDIHYEAFDFHTECKKMRYNRLSILIDRLAVYQDEYGVFHTRGINQNLSYQTGVFRTNCIDCLDRTNVVQSLLAKRSLGMVLENLGIIQRGEALENVSPGFNYLFNGVWADNADIISLQYSGTGALKTDFTRTGKRSLVGVMTDGMNSLTRYYLNNFADGFRQDGINLFLCNYVATSDEGRNVPSPLVSNKSWRYKAFPTALLLTVTMFFYTLADYTEFDTKSLLFLLLWGAMIGVSVTGIFHYETEFVDWPRLHPFHQINT